MPRLHQPHAPNLDPHPRRRRGILPRLFQPHVPHLAPHFKPSFFFKTRFLQHWHTPNTSTVYNAICRTEEICAARRRAYGVGCVGAASCRAYINRTRRTSTRILNRVFSSKLGFFNIATPHTYLPFATQFAAPKKYARRDAAPTGWDV
ncbi:MAG: hypothetical protein OXP71_09820 [Candidatus Poribacteria bacterium]|nr:hypothetical protein [Candidatus Poribacteria bacterium]